MDKFLFRCKAFIKDEIGNMEIRTNKFEVIRETKEYYFIKMFKGERRVLKESKNGFAFDSERKALFNFLMRRKRYQGLLELFKEQNLALIELSQKRLKEMEGDRL